MSTTNRVILWVCFDCLNADANGEDSHEHGRPEPWALWEEGAERPSMGLPWEDHDEDCPNHTALDHVTECDCERREFSWSQCSGCGSILGGYRHAYTL